MLKGVIDALTSALGVEAPKPATVGPAGRAIERNARPQAATASAGARRTAPAPERPIRTTPPPVPQLTVKERKRMANRPPSFTDRLPWADPDPSDSAFHHVDGVTQGVLLEIIPAPTEALPEETMETLRRMAQVSLQSLDESEHNPWIAQFFLCDDRDMEPVKREFSRYIQNAYPKDPERSREIFKSAFTQDYIREFSTHLDLVSRPQGLFTDTLVSGQVWRGQVRRVRCMLYRRFGADGKQASSPGAQLDHAAATLMESITKSGVRVRRCKGKDLYDWLLPFFNRRPAFAKTAGELLEKMPYPRGSGDGDTDGMPSTRRSGRDDDAPLLADFADSINLSQPRSDAEGGWWEFDGIKIKALVLQNLVRHPYVGHFTAEKSRGKETYALFDRLPTGSLLSMTVVIEPQYKVRQRIERIEAKSQARNADAAIANVEAKRVLDAMARGNKLFPLVTTLYIAGETQEELNQAVTAVNAELGPSGLRFIDPRDDLTPLDAFIRGLPMAFDPEFDMKHMRRGRLVFASEIAALLPLFGRARGTGRPGFAFWNRGGEPIFFDPLSSKDRKKNAHLLMLGPTGAGKSASLNYLCMLMMAIYRPRLVIVDAGKSFDLLVQHMKSLGLSTHKVEMSTQGDVSLPPFVHAVRLLDDADVMESFNAADGQAGEDSTAFGKLSEDPRLLAPDLDQEAQPAALDEQAAAPEDENAERRDYLGEMMISAIMMITGGEAKEIERMTRADRYLISRSIIRAAIKAKATGRPHPLTHDVAVELMQMQADRQMSQARRDRAEEMGQAMMGFTSSLRGKLFNRYGADWPEVDVTLVELGTLVQDGYADALTLAYSGIMDSVQSRGERYQYEGRPLIMLTDEAHLVTTSDLLGPKMAKGTKMWRKLNIWLWLATQNMKDFPDSMSRVLSMCEWWLMLTMDKSEIEEVARFRSLTPEQRAMMESAVKEPPKYTEGVTLSSAFTGLFRNVPPAIAIALAMTEGHEKADRMRLMKQHGITEVEAARMVARQLEASRG
jgi:conjugative transfer ATPase